MSLLSREYLITSLRCLQPTQENMQTIALYVRINKNEHAKISEIYCNELAASCVFHRLNLYYLANEILQSEKKNSRFRYLYDAIRAVVLRTFAASKCEAEKYAKLHKKYRGLEDVWVQREIFARGEADAGESEECAETPAEPSLLREDVLARIDELFDSKEALLAYLKEVVARLESDNAP